MLLIVLKQIYDSDSSFKNVLLQDSNVFRENGVSERSQRSLINGAIRAN